MRRRSFLLAAAGAVILRPAIACADKTQQGLFIHGERQTLAALDIKDADGKPAPLPQGQPIVLNLWASWCLPCVAELPSLDRLKPIAAADGVAVVALSLDRMGAGAVRGAHARIGIQNLDIRFDDTRRAAETLAAPVLPVTLLIDAQGREAARFVGPAAWDGPEALALVRAVAANRPLTPAMAPPFVRHKGAAP